MTQSDSSVDLQAHLEKTEFDWYFHYLIVQLYKYDEPKRSRVKMAIMEIDEHTEQIELRRKDRERAVRERKKIQAKREDLYKKRENAVSNGDDAQDDLNQIENELTNLQLEIKRLQAYSQEYQHEIDQLRSLAVKGFVRAPDDDKQTRAEKILTMQEQLQKLKEDTQSQRKERLQSKNQQKSDEKQP